MLYTFFKKMIPVIVIAIVIYLLIFLSYVGAIFASSQIIEQKTIEIKEYSPTNRDFVDNVKSWVYTNIKYEDSHTLEIMPPEITILTKRGDCSEYSLLITRMLNDGGIEAHPTYGSNGADMHESVEYTINNLTRRIDEVEVPNFVKHGNGIQSIEHVYDVYWFLDWKTVIGMNKSDKQWGY